MTGPFLASLKIRGTENLATRATGNRRCYLDKCGHTKGRIAVRLQPPVLGRIVLNYQWPWRQRWKQYSCTTLPAPTPPQSTGEADCIIEVTSHSRQEQKARHSMAQTMTGHPAAGVEVEMERVSDDWEDGMGCSTT